MSKISCPYCYRRFSPGSMLFQCLGRPAPGRQSCGRSSNPERERLTGYSGAMLPTFAPPTKTPLPRRTAPCPDCGVSTGIRACPVCHTPLPANYMDARTPLLGLVGGKNAGKTVYTTVLVHEIRNNLRRRFEADIDIAGEQAGAASARWFDQYHDELFDRGSLFESTPSAAGGIRTPVVIKWRQQRRSLVGGHRTSVLSFFDSAGEDLTTQELVNNQAYLGATGGLIVLLDPFQLPRARDHVAAPDERDAEPPLNVLSRITEMLRNTGGLRDGSRIRTPVAVVFSKIDAFFGMFPADHPLRQEPETGPHYDEASGDDTHEHVRALLDKLGADDVDAHLRAHYRTFRYFAVSSLGAEPEYERKRVDSGGVRPFRVEEPLLWLLARFGIVRSRS